MTLMDGEQVAGSRETQDVELARSQRRAVGWLTACGGARLMVPWLMLPIVDGFVRMNAFSRGLLVQEAALMIPVFVGTANPVLIPWRRPLRANTAAVIHSLTRLQLATVLSMLAVLSMIAGLALGASAGGGAPSIGLYQPAAVIAQTAQHLEWLWWASAAGMVFVMASVAVQPWPLHLETTAAIGIAAVEAGTLLLFLCLHNTLAALGMTLLHLTVGNVLLFPKDWQYELRNTDADHDKGWFENHQDRL